MECRGTLTASLAVGCVLFASLCLVDVCNIQDLLDAFTLAVAVSILFATTSHCDRSAYSHLIVIVDAS